MIYVLGDFVPPCPMADFFPGAVGLGIMPGVFVPLTQEPHMERLYNIKNYIYFGICDTHNIYAKIYGNR